MAPLFVPPIPSLAIPFVTLCVALLVGGGGVYIRRYRQRQRHAVSSAVANKSTSGAHKHEDETTPLLLTDEDPNTPSSSLISYSISAPRSSDLAFALTLPRPSINLHEPTSSSADIYAQHASTEPLFTQSTTSEPAPTAIAERTLQTCPEAVTQTLPSSQRNDDGSAAISARGRVTVAVAVPNEVTATAEGGGPRAVRDTDIFVRHPRFRRRVRTWDIGGVVPTPAPAAQTHDAQRAWMEAQTHEQHVQQEPLAPSVVLEGAQAVRDYVAPTPKAQRKETC